MKYFDDYNFFAAVFEDVLGECSDIKTISNDSTEEEKRIRIFVEALRGKKGITWVEQELEKSNLRPIYVRNLLEFVLQHCFMCNDDGNAYKHYNYDELQKLLSDIQFNDIYLQKSSEMNKLTFEELKKIVNENADAVDFANNGTKTATITIEIENNLRSIDVTKVDAYEDFKDLFITYSETLSETSQIVKFYFAKYIYFIISHQILELQNILLKFSDMTPNEAKKYIESSEDDGSMWSILSGIKRDRLLEKISNDESDKQKAKELLRMTLNNFVLKGAPLKKDNHFKVLLPQEQLSKIKDKTQIFAGGTDAEKHDQYRSAIKNMQISDFLGYTINFNKLYNILFGWFSTNEYDEDSVYKKKYITGILNEKYDMSRSAILMFLASCKSVIHNIDKMQSIDEIGFTKDNELKLKRVNYMLNRMGYINVGDDVDNDSLDELYFTVFTATSSENAAFDSLNDELGDFIENNGFNPIPFEIANISAKERQNRIIKGRI